MLELDNVVWRNEFVGTIDNHAKAGVFTNGGSIEEIGVTQDGRTGKIEGCDFERIGIDDNAGNLTDGGCVLHTENWGTNEPVAVD